MATPLMMVAAAGNIAHRQHRGGLTGGGHQSAYAALQGRDLLLHRVGGGVGQAGIKITADLQIEQIAQGLGAVVFEGGALINGKNPGLAVTRLPPLLYAFGVQMPTMDAAFFFR